MMRPTQLLNYAQELLKVPVREQSVRDADIIDQLLSESDHLPQGGWTTDTLAMLLERVAHDAPVQAHVIRVMANQDGYVSREQVYELAHYPAGRSLRGFTRPINRIAQNLRDEGQIPEEAVDIVTTVYNEQSPNVGWAAGFRVHDDVLPVLVELIQNGTVTEETGTHLQDP